LLKRLRTEERDMAERIMVVDDDKTLANLLVNLLTINGYEASSCTCDRQALKAVYEQEPDLVIIDIVMPDLNGVDVLAKLRANPVTEDIPVVIMSFLSDELYMLEGWVKDGDGYISKPFDPDQLLDCIRMVITKTVQERFEEKAQRIEALLETIQRLEEQYLETAV
jgi:twitching motility two-component system response regulator PilH